MFVSEGEGRPARRLEDCPYIFGLDEITFTRPVYVLMKTYDDFTKKVESTLQFAFDEWIERKGVDEVMVLLNIEPGINGEYDVCVHRTGNAAIVSLYGESEAAWIDDKWKTHEKFLVHRDTGKRPCRTSQVIPWATMCPERGGRQGGGGRRSTTRNRADGIKDGINKKQT